MHNLYHCKQATKEPGSEKMKKKRKQPAPARPRPALIDKPIRTMPNILSALIGIALKSESIQ